MKLSKMLAVFAWLNTFVLMWAMMYSSILLEHHNFATWTLIIFVTIAIVSSTIQAEKR